LDEDASDLPAGAVLALTAPVFARNGVFQGAVRAGIPLASLTDLFLRKVRVLSGWGDASGPAEWQLVGADGTVVAEYPARKAVGTPGPASEAALAAAQAASGPGYIEERHARLRIPVITGFARTGTDGGTSPTTWRVLLRLDRERVLGPVDRARVWLIGFVL